MVNNSIIEYMNKSPQTLSDLASYIDILIKQYSPKEIIEKAGIDKNVLHRLHNKQNITVENYLKIRNAFPNAFRPAPTPEVSDLPILGQIVNETKIQVLNPSQPAIMRVPTNLIKFWQPVFGYYYTDNHSFYHGCVHMFTTKDIDKDCVNRKCQDRLIIVYPESMSPIYGYCVRSDDKYKVLHSITKEELFSCPKVNKVRWSKWISVIPYSLLEFEDTHELSKSEVPEEIIEFPPQSKK